MFDYFLGCCVTYQGQIVSVVKVMLKTTIVAGSPLTGFEL
jgi:hypothetical protein